MLRLIGVFLIFSACCSAGMFVSSSMKSKLDRLRLYRNMTDEIAAFIRYQSLTVREVMKKLSLNKAYSELIFIHADYGDKSRPAFEIWNESLKMDRTIGSDERKLLSQLGEQLGTTDTEGQLSVIAVVNVRLEEMIKKQTEKYAEKGKLYRSIGILAGAMFGILVI